MEIKTITRFKFDGKEYDNLPKVKTEVENRIGTILDQLNPRLTPKQAIQMLEIIVREKAKLHDLLNVTFEVEGETALSGYDKNILDL